jgi:hypothetical protein
MKLHEKRVKELLKGNAIVEKAIELMKTEKSDMACTIRAFHKTAKQMVEVKKLLSSPKFRSDMKKAEIKGFENTKNLVPIVLGISYPKFARELQVAKVTQTQLDAFIKAVKEDDSISVSKQGLLSFVKGKKRAKTDSVKPTAEPTNAGGGKEETKDGGEEATPKVRILASLSVRDVQVEIIDNNGVREVRTDATPQQIQNALSTFKTMIEALPTKVLKK